MKAVAGLTVLTIETANEYNDIMNGSSASESEACAHIIIYQGRVIKNLYGLTADAFDESLKTISNLDA